MRIPARQNCISVGTQTILVKGVKDHLGTGGDLCNGDAAVQEQSHQGLSGTGRFMHSGDAVSRNEPYLGPPALVGPYKSWQARIASAQSSTDKGVGEIHASVMPC
jgi:hypothetical protein